MKCWWLSFWILERCVAIALEKTQEMLHSRGRYDSQTSRNMPPITCESNEGSTIKTVDEYKFRVLIEQELRSAHDTKFTHWGIPDLTKFCDTALCGKEGNTRVTGDSRSLCIVYVLEIRCREQTKMQSDEGKSLTMQCFLAQQHGAGVDKYLGSDLISLFDLIREGVYKKYVEESPACGNFHLPDGRCDFSAAAESGFLKQLTNDPGHIGTQACKQFTASPNDLVTLQPLSGSIASFPVWLEPPLGCDLEQEYLMHILIRARKLRIHFMQSWFLKMENEVFRGNRLWFEKALQRYHPASGAGSLDSDAAIDADKEDEDEDESKEKQYDMTKSEVTTNELLKDQKLLADLDQKMNTQYDFRRPTLSEKKLTGWEYEHAALSLNPATNRGKFRFTNLDEAINSHDTLDVKYISDKDLFKPPQQIGGDTVRHIKVSKAPGRPGGIWS
eukprot:GEMP01021994.1.p1 GENE.GEMP01021994.1~~GEMP01021994.1.p1  ORF type:complete len:444 (+),score=86.32 GEMP01021994.1:293-1624(+)